MKLMGYRPQRKRGVRLKIAGSYIYLPRKIVALIALGSIGAFIALNLFLYWLWAIRIPEVTQP